MKKTYIAPEIELGVVLYEHAMLTASDPDNRNAEGGPTTGTNGLPTGVTNTSDVDDPFGNHGQDGNTTRAKMWDDTWDLPQWWNF